MAKLYESRKTNLNNPLDKNEVGYIFKSDNVNSIIKCIDGKMYGAYLIGGIVGTGKSSLVDIAAAYSREKSLVIHVNFYNEEEAIDKFSTIVLECLIESLENDQEAKSEQLSELLKQYKMRLLYSIEERIDKSEITNNDIKQTRKEKVSIFSKIGMALNTVILSEVSVNGDESLENEDINETNRRINSYISLNKIERDRIKDILNIIRQLNNINIIFVFDELDKMNTDVLKIFFERYKSLFVENNIFHFFLVDDEMYIKYNNNNICKNKLFTYFSGKYYMPLLTFKETVRYCVMMFGEKYYLMCLMQYYNTLGNYRLLNICYNEHKYIERMTIIKAYILTQVINAIDVPYLEKYYVDLIVKKIKIIIEESIRLRNCSIENFKAYLKENNAFDIVWPGNDELIDKVIDVINKICPRAINVDNDCISVNATILYYEYGTFEKAALLQRRENLALEQLNYIQLSDMYHYIKNGENNIYRRINFLRDSIIPLKVDDNNPLTYEEALINLIKANLCEQDLQVIILERERGEESFFVDDHAYTGMVIVNKGIFQIAYYVNQGSYDSDAFYAKEKLKRFANEYKIDVQEIEIDKYIDLDKDIIEIVKKYNNV